MIKKEVTQKIENEFGGLTHVKTVWKILGIPFLIIKTETL